MVTDEEIEATRKRSEELDVQIQIFRSAAAVHERDRTAVLLRDRVTRDAHQRRESGAGAHQQQQEGGTGVPHR